MPCFKKGAIINAVKIRNFGSEIEFTNNGNLSFFFLGIGNAFSKELSNTNLLIVKGKDHLLVDCGALTPLSFKKYNSKLSDVENIIITHAHADHIGGLEEVALLGRYITHKKPLLFAEKRFKNELWKQSLKGGLGLCGEEGQRQKLNFEDYFDWVQPVKMKNMPRPFFTVNIGSINVKIFRTKHEFISSNNWKTGMYSIGLLIDDRIVVSGDTKFDKPLLDYLTSNYKIEHIFHDCSFRESAVHTSYEELKSLPLEIRQKLTLCHYEDSMKDFDPVKDGFSGLGKAGIYYDF